MARKFKNTADNLLSILQIDHLCRQKEEKETK